jgi:hypothetical protein
MHLCLYIQSHDLGATTLCPQKLALNFTGIVRLRTKGHRVIITPAICFAEENETLSTINLLVFVAYS